MKLSVEEYLVREEEFWKKYDKYVSEKTELIKSINKLDEKYDIDNMSYEDMDKLYRDKEHIELTKKLHALETKYKDYTSPYRTDFYAFCTTEDEIRKTEHYQKNATITCDHFKKIFGKECVNWKGENIGICIGVAVFIDEVYFVCKLDGKEETFELEFPKLKNNK